MAKARSPDWKNIKKEYIKLNGDVKLKEFAKEHGVKYSTLRSRKNRENWDSEINKDVATKSATQQKNVATENKTKNNDRKPIAEEVKEVLDNIELTDKQRLFCVYYIKYFNATKSYQKAYKCDYITANTNGPRLLVNACIKKEIQRLKEGRLNRAMLEPEDIFQKFIDIAFADISDYVTFGRKEIEVDKDEEDNPVMIEVNYVDFKNSNEVDGTLISEVSQGKNGVSVKLQDKMKAMKWLADHMDLATEEQKARIEVLKSKIANNEKSKEDKIDEYFTKLEEGIKNAK
ncbi:phage terminase small subunit [Clostridium tetani]|uniref:terminase small subunit n=1 Tax=Clostridium tetani TaxID=1513 RepID=UPI00295337B0|nr:terminase small subunit [Clostridium tetani]BDR66989.1 phage terminase small subunit [Clostridium tetani]